MLGFPSAAAPGAGPTPAALTSCRLCYCVGTPALAKGAARLGLRREGRQTAGFRKTVVSL
eukprot:10651245-Heterocapsa_arctica.AAC.1